ncbi:hypothetical protein HNY73_016881 [Argiope bruennichi]|uniref:Uncharacterized protein n=1 Tax=Argiope bruennichi TaxID=94029 RepID=A0A8T0ENR7_ARGBR|nr:hypothetical protein HNY73_016881 [Argiope bruennichi]
MKHLVFSLVLCFVIALASSEIPNYRFYKQYFIPNGGQPQVVAGGQPANGGGQQPNYYGGGQQPVNYPQGGYNPNYYYGGGQQPNYYNGGCKQVSCHSYCTIGTRPDGCPECICIQN